MRRWFVIALMLIAATVSADVTTTKFVLAPTTWTDLGVGPLTLSATGSAVFAIGDTTPALPANEGGLIPSDDSIALNTNSHVWAMPKNATIGASVFTAPAVFGGGGAVTSPHRYWRIYLTNLAGQLYSIAEIQFRTTAGTPLLFSGGTAKANYYGPGFEPILAADGNPATQWSAPDASPQGWEYDYGAGNTKNIVELTIQARGDTAPALTPTALTPQWSDDEVTWTSMLPIVTATPWTAGQIQTFPVAPVCAEATAYLARAPGETAHSADLTALICGLVSDGVWSKLDALYVLAQQTQTDALLNLVSTNYNGIGSLVSTDFTAYQGFYMNSFKYVDTQFDPTVVVGAKYTQNNASYGLWTYSVASSVGCQAGRTSGNETAMYIKFTSDGNFYARLNNVSGGVLSTVVGGGMFVADRPDASLTWPYQNGVSAGGISAPSIAMPVGTIWFGFCGSSGAGADQILSEAHIGASLGAAGNLALYNRVKTYMATLPASKPGPKPPDVINPTKP